MLIWMLLGSRGKDFLVKYNFIVALIGGFELGCVKSMLFASLVALLWAGFPTHYSGAFVTIWGRQGRILLIFDTLGLLWL